MSPTSFQTAPPRDTYLTYYIHISRKYATFLEVFDFLMDGGGFEPPKALLTDLQSAPFGHSGTHPKSR